MLSSDEKSAHAAIAYILTFQHVNICFFGLENFTAALLHLAFLASVSSDSGHFMHGWKKLLNTEYNISFPHYSKWSGQNASPRIKMIWFTGKLTKNNFLQILNIV